MTYFLKTRIFGATEDVFAAFAEGIRRADRIGAEEDDPMQQEE